MPERLGDRPHRQGCPVGNVRDGRGGTQLGGEQREEVALCHRLVVDEQVSPAIRPFCRAGQQGAFGHIPDINQRQVIAAGPHDDHAALLGHPCQAPEARGIAGAVNPPRAHDRHRRVFVPDHAPQQFLAGHLRPAVRVCLGPQRRILVRCAAHVVPVHCNGADVHEPADTGRHGRPHQCLETVHVHLLVFRRRAPWSGTCRAVDDAVHTSQRGCDREAIGYVTGVHVSTGRGGTARVGAGADERPGLFTPREEQRDHVAAEEACRSRYQDRHRLSNLRGAGATCCASSGSSRSGRPARCRS